MPRVAAPIIKLPGANGQTPYIDIAPLLVAATMTPNFNYWLLQDGDILVVQNVGVAAHIITLAETPDKMGRTYAPNGFSSHNIAADRKAVYFGPFASDGWVQSGADAGRVHFDCDHVDLHIGVLRR